MAQRPDDTAAHLVPADPTLPSLQQAAAGCRACDLWTKGTQTVFGEGGTEVDLMLIGEQPGDEEDTAGRPFVGPAGRLLDRALRDAGIDRRQTYVTNAVKHFNWQGTRGKRRIHKTPNYREVIACKSWLEAEVRVVRPRLLVALGATAAASLLGREFRISLHRGQVVDSPLGPVLVTVHPSSVLRAQDDAARHLQMAAFVEDLKQAAPAASRQHGSKAS